MPQWYLLLHPSSGRVQFFNMKNTVRAISYANYASNYERYIRSEIGFIRLADINAAHIQKLLNSLHEKG